MYSSGVIPSSSFEIVATTPASAYTSGSAWLSLEERERGTLTPGMLADLAVLNDDFFGVAESAIPELRSVLTMVGGRIVHAEAPFDWS